MKKAFALLSLAFGSGGAFALLFYYLCYRFVVPMPAYTADFLKYVLYGSEILLIIFGLLLVIYLILEYRSKKGYDL